MGDNKNYLFFSYCLSDLFIFKGSKTLALCDAPEVVIVDLENENLRCGSPVCTVRHANLLKIFLLLGSEKK